MKNIALFWLFIFSFSLSFSQAPQNPLSLKTKYVHYSLPFMVKMADVIITSKITGVTETHFTVEVLTVLKGNLPEYELDIKRKLTDGGPMSRWTEYAKGQRQLLFLHFRIDEEEWEVLGKANEGELPMLAASTFYLNPGYSFDQTGADVQEYKVYGGVFKGYMMDLPNYIKAFNEFEAETEMLIRVGKRSKYNPPLLQDFGSHSDVHQRISREITEDSRVWEWKKARSDREMAESSVLEAEAEKLAAERMTAEETPAENQNQDLSTDPTASEGSESKKKTEKSGKKVR